MDLTLPGKKLEIVYSICRIRQFTDTTECLQEEIIVFVNKIVRIIHLCAQTWNGKPTKNYGEQYLITWRLPSYENAVDFKVKEPIQIAPPDLDEGKAESEANMSVGLDSNKSMNEKTSLLAGSKASSRSAAGSSKSGDKSSKKKKSKSKVIDEKALPEPEP